MTKVKIEVKYGQSVDGYGWGRRAICPWVTRMRGTAPRGPRLPSSCPPMPTRDPGSTA
jgi:hypothetical protein